MLYVVAGIAVKEGMKAHDSVDVKGVVHAKNADGTNPS